MEALSATGGIAESYFGRGPSSHGAVGTMVTGVELFWRLIGSTLSSLCTLCTFKWSDEGWCPLPNCTGAAAAEKPEPGGDDAEESVHFRG